MIIASLVTTKPVPLEPPAGGKPAARSRTGTLGLVWTHLVHISDDTNGTEKTVRTTKTRRPTMLG
jgi:hypothetical protein